MDPPPQPGKVLLMAVAMVVTIALASSALDGRGLVPALSCGGHFLLYGAQDWSKQAAVDIKRQEDALPVATGVIPAPPVRSIAVVLSIYEEGSFQDLFETLSSALHSMRHYASSMMYPPASHLVVVMDGSSQDNSSQLKTLTGRGNSDPVAAKAYLARSFRRRLDEAMDLVYRMEDDPPGLLSRLEVSMPKAVVLDQAVGRAATRNIGSAIAASLGADTLLFLDGFDQFQQNYVHDTLMMLVGLGNAHCSVRGWAATQDPRSADPRSVITSTLTARLPSTLVIRRWCFDLVGGWPLPPATKHSPQGTQPGSASASLSDDLYMTVLLAELANATATPVASGTKHPGGHVAAQGVPASRYSPFWSATAPQMLSRGVVHDTDKNRPAFLSASKNPPAWLVSADLAATKAAKARASELVSRLRQQNKRRA